MNINSVKTIHCLHEACLPLRSDILLYGHDVKRKCWRRCYYVKYCMTPLDVHSTNTVGFVNGIGGSVVESTTITSLSFQMKNTKFAAACICCLLHILDQWGLISAISSTIHSAAISIGLAPKFGEPWPTTGELCVDYLIRSTVVTFHTLPYLPLETHTV